ncbi:protein TonB [Saccharicrinis carchari]|uniref:Protein TonB n=1 Tax=Saccharicrinis carchari TaxID=1168039 RepID=A0A521DNG0_SACCC|nr:energy transducer TonB [Saccharicrinis carchari]SMO73115.1 protein TonB [Saccharicrinis carchari]
MIPRKSTQADLEHKRSMFFQIGLVISLAIVLFMMELNFKTRDVNQSLIDTGFRTEEEMVPITRQELKTPPPPPPKKIMATDIISIVDDDVELDEELELFDSETDQDQEIKLIEIPVNLEEEVEEEAPIFIVVEEMPIFRPQLCATPEEGNRELMKFVSQAIRYPVIAAENGIQGRVYVTFVVSPNGSVTDVQVSRGVDAALDKEAIRVVQELPEFSPGKQRGKPVRVQYSIPINFILQ